jgi:hypothetical protein
MYETNLAFRCTCDICAHIWQAHELPKRCAGCKSFRWDRGGPGKAGRPRNPVPAEPSTSNVGRKRKRKP